VKFGRRDCPAANRPQKGDIMNSDKTASPAATLTATAMADLLEQYGCGPIRFTGHGDALYERHLMFDNVIDPAEVGPRERYEAVAHSVRDILSQRWHRTDHTYDRENPKRVYYLSMEFLIGRSLGNNIINLRLDPIAQRVLDERDLDGLAIQEEEPDAGLGNGGLGRLAACFLDSMATMQLPAMGYGLRYEYGIFRQTIVDGWQFEEPDNWLRWPDPWEVARPREVVEIKLGCSFEIRSGNLQAVFDRPSSLLGIPFDRPIVGYGGKNINPLLVRPLPNRQQGRSQRGSTYPQWELKELHAIGAQKKFACVLRPWREALGDHARDPRWRSETCLGDRAV